MADEDLVTELDPVAEEAVALDLAALADDDSALDLDERADTRPCADPASVEVRERVDDDVSAELDAVDDPVRASFDGALAIEVVADGVDDRRLLLLGDSGEERQRERPRAASRSATGNDPSP